MAKPKKYNGFPKLILKRPIDHTEYMRLRRSNDPAQTAKDMGLLDEKNIKRLARLLLCGIYYGILIAGFSGL